MREHEIQLWRALSTQNLRSGHTFDWDHIEVVNTKPRSDWWKATEAIYIRVRNADINWEIGYDLPPIYMALLREEWGTHVVKTCTLWRWGHCIPWRSHQFMEKHQKVIQKVIQPLSLWFNEPSFNYSKVNDTIFYYSQVQDMAVYQPQHFHWVKLVKWVPSLIIVLW